MRCQNSKTASRRNFIRNSVLTAAGFMIVPRHVLGGKGFVAPSDKLLIAGVGVGGKGRSDIGSFHNTGKAEIAFLCDVDERRAADAVKSFPKAKFYKDWRELFSKEHKQFDAVSVSTPDHTHAVATLAAMQLGKHVYVQKPLSHDIWEARQLTEAAKKYKVVTQMGNQGSSNDGTRQLKEWYEAGLVGDIHTVYCWTNRPVWPQGVPWPSSTPAIPKELDWDLWLGTAPWREYIDKLVPFNWRGWWDYGTGALGDMGCHLVEAPFRVLELTQVKDVQASIGTVFIDTTKEGYFPESCPPSSHATLTFAKTPKTKSDIVLHWMDGGIQPERPPELGLNDLFGDGRNGMLFVGTKGKMLANVYAEKPRLLPLNPQLEQTVKPRYNRVQGQANGHYAQWVEAAIAGYGKKELSAPFETAGPLTEATLIANLAIRGCGLRVQNANGKLEYPGRAMKYLWDHANMKVLNFDLVNQFIKREYRGNWL